VIGAFIGERLLYAFRDPVALQLLDGISEVLGSHDVGLLLLAGDEGPPRMCRRGGTTGSARRCRPPSS
jgi:hypothetical protein